MANSIKTITNIIKTKKIPYEIPVKGNITIEFISKGLCNCKEKKIIKDMYNE